MEKQITSKDWKFCAVVDLGIENIEEQQIQFNEHYIRIFKPSDRRIQDLCVAEVYSFRSKYSDNETAFHNSLDILNKVLDRISIATFRSCKIVSPISVTQFRAEKNENFTMLLTANFIVQPKIKAFSAQNYPFLFSNIDEQDINDCISEFSLAINNSSIYQKFQHYYNCIERIAQFLTTENVNYKCKSCGAINEIPLKATGSKMREFFIKNGYNNKVFNKCRAIRGKLAHGSSQRTRKLNLEIFENISILEKIAIQLIEENTPLKIVEGEIIPRSIDQFVEIIGKKKWHKNFFTKSAYDIVSHSFKSTLRINEIGKNNMKEGFITEHLPLPFNPRHIKIFPYAWPY
ncbi:hypothetical protein LA303_03785 [Candidatus Sulfidibacterium hydrothermale]|uniref:hypothetical protein n=1 Tax=Candidatus Sulfidibacterium hydrothermale TaxID=2875962 RepID=UPI001F0A6C0C|nr:hypothetical protein [Candidatus Sulfidibacterium hydrothermale]UBM63102.1 hypothetical protein LA303_03785 [Candidatus Sulfidibacterium hydrothermale]